MSASITPVFHQEMALYYLRPSFEYQVGSLSVLRMVWEVIFEVKSIINCVLASITSRKLKVLFLQIEILPLGSPSPSQCVMNSKERAQIV